MFFISYLNDVNVTNIHNMMEVRPELLSSYSGTLPLMQHKNTNKDDGEKIICWFISGEKLLNIFLFSVLTVFVLSHDMHCLLLDM